MTYQRKACSHPGCPTVHRNKGAYCDAHRKVKDDSYRPNAADRGYDRDWQKYRIQYLRDHPWCVCPECRKGKPLKANVVDHITPHRGNKELFWARWNHQPMNKMCHDRKTVEQDGGLGR
jgi:5-methylcytosine-specific restriction protein A